VEVQQQGESKGTEVARHTIDKKAREAGRLFRATAPPTLNPLLLLGASV
jgi:hypothetical protein